MTEHDYIRPRRAMVERQLTARGIRDSRVIEAMLKVPRHLFVEEALRGQAYGDFALPIGEKQTISQPHTVALMTEALQLRPADKVLEIGTGSGYQAAVLAQIVTRVFSVERLPEMARRARRILDASGCAAVHIKVGDGTLGWPEEAPFDAIIVTAGAPALVKAYCEQLAVGGRLVMPVGNSSSQVIHRVTCIAPGKFRHEELQDCRFVPLIGIHGWQAEQG